MQPNVRAVVTAWKRLNAASDNRERALIRGTLHAALDRLSGMPTDIVVDGDQGREPTVRRLTSEEQNRLADNVT